MQYYKRIYYYVVYFIYILYGFIYLGLWDKAPEYLYDINYILKVFVALLLVYFFNPLHKFHNFGKFHRDIAFSAGMFLLTTVTLTSLKSSILDIYNNVNKF